MNLKIQDANLTSDLSYDSCIHELLDELKLAILFCFLLFDLKPVFSCEHSSSSAAPCSRCVSIGGLFFLHLNNEPVWWFQSAVLLSAHGGGK